MDGELNIVLKKPRSTSKRPTRAVSPVSFLVLSVSLFTWFVVGKRQGKLKLPKLQPGAEAFKTAAATLRVVEHTQQAAENAGILGLQQDFLGQASPQGRGKG